MAAWSPQANEIFLAAAEIASPHDRQRYLNEACGNDAALRGAVEELLRAGVRAAQSEFLESHADSSAAATFSQAPSAAPKSDETTGALIGNYKLLERIGEGGFGVVFMAEQLRPVQRRVAIKIIKPGMDSAQVIARFEAERQALALMDHPNIAKVLDAGTTDAGRPYFVMELVKGVPITKYCDEQHLTPRERLELFIPVCQAVQHAHQKGVIHRDLKPSNVLIALYDGRPVPKVIDFGVAKAIAQKLTERTMFTEIGSIVGTVEYMSPEQAELNNLDIDTRADIYSLGVILYELLTGSPPFTAAQLRGAAFDQMLRMIREVEPQKPSTRLSTAAELPSIAANRKLEPGRLTRLVHGELDWIVMKCLEKVRTRRYETANGLSMDLQRFLADEPVLAGAPSAAYRLRKFVRRNRGPVTAAAMMALLLIAGVLATSLALIRERAAKLQALDAAEAENKAKQIAEARETETRAVLNFVQTKVFAAARPQGYEGGLGHDVKLREAVEAAVPFVDTSFVNQPLIEARLRSTLATSFLYLGDLKKASEQSEKVRALYMKHLGPSHPDTLRSMNDAGNSYYRLGRYAEAIQLYTQTLTVQKATLGPDHADTISCMSNLASSYSALGRHADALQLNTEVLALRKGKLGADHPDTLMSMNNLSNNYAALGRYADALKLREETLALRQVKLSPDHPDTLSSMYSLATSYAALGRYADATKLHAQALRLRQQKLGPEHPDTLASTMGLAYCYGTLDRLDDALALFEQALAISKAKLGAEHPYVLDAMNNVAITYNALGRHEEALKLHEQTLLLTKAKFGPDHPRTFGSMNNMVNAYTKLGRHAEALELCEQALALMEVKLGRDHPDTIKAIANLTNSYANVGRHADALRFREEALVLRKAKLGPDHPDTLQSMWAVAESMVMLGRGAEAVPIIDECVGRAMGKVVDPDLIPEVMHLRLRHFQNAKDPAGCLETADKWDALKRADAQSLYRSACMRAVCAAMIRETDKTPAGDVKAKAQADQAMAWLKQAVAAGYQNAAHATQDADLDALRDRDDFKALLAELQGRLAGHKTTSPSATTSSAK